MAVNADKNEEIFRTNDRLCHFSKNGEYLALAFESNILIRDAKSSKICYTFNFEDEIQYMEWSPNSEYILCANIEKSTVHVYSLHYTKWKCKLIEGSIGMKSVTWFPDSGHICTMADFNIQISIWNLTKQTASYIQNVKSSAFDKLHFTPNGEKLAVIVTEQDQDVVVIYKYDGEDWKLNQKITCYRLRDVDGIRWSPNNELLCIWTTSSVDPKVIIYSCAIEKQLAVFAPLEESEKPKITWNFHKTSPDIEAIQHVEWIPSGLLLAVFGYNGKIILLNYITWRPLLKFSRSSIVEEKNYLTKVYEECEVDSEKVSYPLFAFATERVLREIHERPKSIKLAEQSLDTKNWFTIKVKLFAFSSCGQYLALCDEFFPTTVFIWNIHLDCIDYLLLENPITAIKWSPAHPRLLAISDCPRLYEWTPKKVNSVPIPRNMTVIDANWHPTGGKVILLGYKRAMIYEIPNTS